MGNIEKFPGKDSPDAEEVIAEGRIVNIDSGEEVGTAQLVAVRSTVNDAGGSVTTSGYSREFAANYDSVFRNN